jgi:membrane-bound metal-dependent hydrolase YbcI (DUF457 family)
MVFSHAFAGAITTKFLLNKSKGITISRDLAYFVGIVASVFPDFDIAVLFLFPDLQHRYFVTHSLLVYLILYLVVILISKIIKKKELGFLASVFFLGVLSHLILDFLGGGIAALAPFVSQLYGFELIWAKYTPEDRLGWAIAYMKSPYMLGELALFIIYLGVILKNEVNKVARRLPLAAFVVSVITLVILSFI